MIGKVPTRSVIPANKLYNMSQRFVVKVIEDISISQMIFYVCYQYLYTVFIRSDIKRIRLVTQYMIGIVFKNNVKIFKR